ncbi:MAG: PASTA domain-containing protein [Paludibacteraceae bacterium]
MEKQQKKTSQAKKNGGKAWLTLLWNLLLALVIIVLLVVGLWFWLRAYTHHGEEVDVPSVVGLYLPEAEPVVHAAGMVLVITDSTFTNNVPLGAIAEQTPPAGSHAKHGRQLYVVVNATCKRQVMLPDVHDLSYRQAAATLRSVGVRVSDDYEWEPSEYKDLVLDVKYNGESLPVGARVDEGAEVTLVVGFGKGTEMTDVPNVVGRSLPEARALLLSQRLTVGTVEYDETVDESGRTESGEMPVVYSQTPELGQRILEGSMVNLKLSADIEKAVTTHNTDSEDEWF